MDEQSIWKKEISFRRKPKQEKSDEPTEESRDSREESPSIWKKEISFGPKKQKAEAEPPPAPAVEAEVAKAEPAATQSIWKKEISFGRKKEKVEAESRPESAPAAEPPVRDSGPGEGDGGNREVPPATTPAPTSIWKKEISFGRKAKPEPEPAETFSDEAAPEPEKVAEALSAPEPVAAVVEHTSASDAEPEPDPVAVEEVAVSDSQPATEEPAAAPEPSPEESVWKKEVSFSRKPTSDEAAEPVAEQPAPVAEEPAAEVAAQPPAEEPAEVVGEDPAAAGRAELLESWTRKPKAAEPVGEQEPVAEEAPLPEQPAAAEVDDPAAAQRAALLESWTRTPNVPTTPTAEDAPTAEIPAPAPGPATVVHPPVPAAELPPLPGEKVPFWKKEISLGGGKKKQKEPKQAKEPKQPKESRQKKPRVPKVKAERVKGGKNAKRVVGLKIGASQLAAARVANNGSAELLQVAREPLEPGIVVGGELRDPEALAAALKDFFAKHKLPKKGVRLGIANNRIGVRTFEIAGIDDPKQLGNAIRFRAQEALPIPIDEAVLDYQILGEDVDEEGQATRRILLVVAYRELIDRYVDACRKAGVTLVGIDLEAFALLRALQAPQEGVGDDPSAALVAVAIGHERSTFAVSDGRICEFTRVLEWGGSALNVAIARVLNAAPSEVEGVKRGLSLGNGAVPEGLTAEQTAQAVDAVRKAVQTFARELVSSLQYYQNQPGSLGIGEIVLTGGTAHLPGLAAELEGLIGVRVRVGDPLARMKVSKKVGDPEQVGSLAVAIGLGIED